MHPINKICYPRQIQFQSYQGTTISEFDIQELELTSTNKYHNLHSIKKLFIKVNNNQTGYYYLINLKGKMSYKLIE